MQSVINVYGKNLKKLIVLQMLLCVLLIVAISCLPRDKREVKFDNSNLLGGKIAEGGYACFEESDGVYGIVLDVTTGEVRKGWYKVRIEYETGYDDNGFIVQALRPGNILNQDIGNEEKTVSLKSYHNSQEVHAWLKEDSELRVGIHFCGGGYLKIKEITIYEIPNYTLAIFFILCMAVLNYELWETIHFSREEAKRRRYIRGGIASIALLGSIPLFLSGYNSIVVHDYTYHTNFMEGIAEGLLSGQFPVRIMPNGWNQFGDGGPLFYSHLLEYFAAFMILLNYPIQTAYTCYVVFINVLTAWIAYQCFFKISKGHKIALIGSFLYSLSLYRLIDIYIRGAVGEYTALTFLPLVLLGIYLIEERGWIYLALGITGCIQSHALACIMIAFFFVCFSLIKIKYIVRKQVFLNFCKAGIVSLLWNLWFLFPFINLYATKSYNIHIYEPVDNFEEWRVPISKNFKLYFDRGETFFVMGLPLLVGLLLAIILLAFYRKKFLEKEQDRKLEKLLNASIWFGIFALFLTTEFMPYHRIGNIHVMINRLWSTFEFPFRFMGAASLFAAFSFVSAYTLWVNQLKNEEKRMVWSKKCIIVGLPVALLLIGLFLSYWKLIVGNLPPVGRSEYYVEGFNIYGVDKWLPIGVDKKDLRHELLMSSESIAIMDYEKKYTNIKMACVNEGTDEGYVDVPLFYYPCYQAKDVETGEILPLTYGENKRVRIMLPSGYQGTVSLRVKERILWRITELISLFSIVISIIIVVRRKKLLRHMTDEENGGQLL